MENKTLSYQTVGTLLLIIIVLAVWQSYSSKTPSVGEIQNMANLAPTESEGEMDTTTATTTATTTTNVANTNVNEPAVRLTTKIYSNARYQFQFSYPSDWKRTDAVAYGEYKDALVFVRASDEAAITAKVSLDSTALTQAVTDRAVIVRIFENESLNSLTARLYGPGIVISQIKVGGKNVTKIVHSKSTDTTNWQGGSTEAYFYKNSLGQSILIEAKYSSAEPQTDGLLKAMLDSAIASFKLITL